jgi:hypothetical protein
MHLAFRHLFCLGLGPERGASRGNDVTESGRTAPFVAGRCEELDGLREAA